MISPRRVWEGYSAIHDCDNAIYPSSLPKGIALLERHAWEEDQGAIMLWDPIPSAFERLHREQPWSWKRLILGWTFGFSSFPRFPYSSRGHAINIQRRILTSPRSPVSGASKPRNGPVPYSPGSVVLSIDKDISLLNAAIK